MKTIENGQHPQLEEEKTYHTGKEAGYHRGTKKGSSQWYISCSFEVPKSTVVDIWKARDKIQLHVMTSDIPSVAKKHCILRECLGQGMLHFVFTATWQRRCSSCPTYKIEGNPVNFEKFILTKMLPYSRLIQVCYTDTVSGME